MVAVVALARRALPGAVGVAPHVSPQTAEANSPGRNRARNLAVAPPALWRLASDEVLVAAVAVALSRQAPEAAPAVAPACLWRLVRALLMLLAVVVAQAALAEALGVAAALLLRMGRAQVVVAALAAEELQVAPRRLSRMACAAEVLAAVAVALTPRAPEAVPQSEPTGESARGVALRGCSCSVLADALVCAAALVVVPLAREAAEPALAVAPAFS